MVKRMEISQRDNEFAASERGVNFAVLCGFVVVDFFGYVIRDSLHEECREAAACRVERVEVVLGLFGFDVVFGFELQAVDGDEVHTRPRKPARGVAARKGESALLTQMFFDDFRTNAFMIDFDCFHGLLR